MEFIKICPFSFQVLTTFFFNFLNLTDFPNSNLFSQGFSQAVFSVSADFSHYFLKFNVFSKDFLYILTILKYCINCKSIIFNPENLESNNSHFMSTLVFENHILGMRWGTCAMLMPWNFDRGEKLHLWMVLWIDGIKLSGFEGSTTLPLRIQTDDFIAAESLCPGGANLRNMHKADLATVRIVERLSRSLRAVKRSFIVYPRGSLQYYSLLQPIAPSYDCFYIHTVADVFMHLWNYI